MVPRQPAEIQGIVPDGARLSRMSSTSLGWFEPLDSPHAANGWTGHPEPEPRTACRERQLKQLAPNPGAKARGFI
jgi:hypothetical protein